jgi:hypothetical protein
MAPPVGALGSGLAVCGVALSLLVLAGGELGLGLLDGEGMELGLGLLAVGGSALSLLVLAGGELGFGLLDGEGRELGFGLLAVGGSALSLLVLAGGELGFGLLDGEGGELGFGLIAVVGRVLSPRALFGRAIGFVVSGVALPTTSRRGLATLRCAWLANAAASSSTVGRSLGSLRSPRMRRLSTEGHKDMSTPRSRSDEGGIFRTRSETSSGESALNGCEPARAV